jgi:hypothetical protein
VNGKIKFMLLEISVDLQTALAEEAHPTEEHRLEKQLEEHEDDCLQNRRATFRAIINIY